MSVSVVARRYAQAILELGSEQNELDRLVDEFATLAAAWASNAELRAAIENPLVPRSAKKAIVAGLTDSITASVTTRHALQILVDRRRAKALPFIAQTLRELAEAKKGLLRAEVTTATPLSEVYYARLQAQLETMTGQRVVVDRKTDPSLIAGVVTRIGDRIFDGSLRTRLDTLKDSLMPAANQ